MSLSLGKHFCIIGTKPANVKRMQELLIGKMENGPDPITLKTFSTWLAELGIAHTLKYDTETKNLLELVIGSPARYRIRSKVNVLEMQENFNTELSSPLKGMLGGFNPTTFNPIQETSNMNTTYLPLPMTRLGVVSTSASLRHLNRGELNPLAQCLLEVESIYPHAPDAELLIHASMRIATTFGLACVPTPNGLEVNDITIQLLDSAPAQTTAYADVPLKHFRIRANDAYTHLSPSSLIQKVIRILQMVESTVRGHHGISLLNKAINHLNAHYIACIQIDENILDVQGLIVEVAPTQTREFDTRQDTYHQWLPRQSLGMGYQPQQRSTFQTRPAFHREVPHDSGVVKCDMFVTSLSMGTKVSLDETTHQQFKYSGVVEVLAMGGVAPKISNLVTAAPLLKTTPYQFGSLVNIQNENDLVSIGNAVVLILSKGGSVDYLGFTLVSGFEEASVLVYEGYGLKVTISKTRDEGDDTPEGGLHSASELAPVSIPAPLWVWDGNVIKLQDDAVVGFFRGMKDGNWTLPEDLEITDYVWAKWSSDKHGVVLELETSDGPRKILAVVSDKVTVSSAPEGLIDEVRFGV